MEEKEEEPEGVLTLGLVRDFEDPKEQHAQAIQDILARAKVTRTENTETTVHTWKQTEKEVQDTDGMLEQTGLPIMQAVYTLLAQLDKSREEAYRDYCRRLFKLLDTVQIDKSSTSSPFDLIREKFLSHTTDSSLPWRQLEGLKNLDMHHLLSCEDQALIATFLVSTNPELRVLARAIMNNTFQVHDKQALKNELQKASR